MDNTSCTSINEMVGSFMVRKTVLSPLGPSGYWPEPKLSFCTPTGINHVRRLTRLFLLKKGRIGQAFFLCAPEKKLKAEKLKNSVTQGKKLKLKGKTPLYGIFCEKNGEK